MEQADNPARTAGNCRRIRQHRRRLSAFRICRKAEFDISSLAHEARKLFDEFSRRNGFEPRLFLESGRYMTGPYGVLVTSVQNRMSKVSGVNMSGSRCFDVGFDAYLLCMAPIIISLS
jgi:hypothetical protein